MLNARGCAQCIRDAEGYALCVAVDDVTLFCGGTGSDALCATLFGGGTGRAEGDVPSATLCNGGCGEVRFCSLVVVKEVCAVCLSIC